MSGVRKNQQGDSTLGRNIQESAGPGAGTEAAAAQTAGGAHQGGGEKGSTRRTEGPLGQPGVTRRRARG